jgi:hypothetical protein
MSLIYPIYIGGDSWLLSLFSSSNCLLKSCLLIASLRALTSSCSERKGDVETIDMSEDDDMKMSECGAERDSDDVNEITEGRGHEMEEKVGERMGEIAGEDSSEKELMAYASSVDEIIAFEDRSGKGRNDPG